MRELTLAVVGIDFANADGSNRRFEIALCRPGDHVDLRPEPRNRFDSSAVAVWRRGGGQIGYLSAERSGWIGTRMAAEGAEAIFQGLGRDAAFIRVRFGGGRPTLPPSAARACDARSAHDIIDPDGPEWGA